MNQITGNLTQREEQTIQRLADALPHGSGIDCDWHIIMHNNGNISASNSYHCMDKNGFYDGWADFTAHFRKKRSFESVNLRGPCEGMVQITYLTGDYELKVTFGQGPRKYVEDLGDYLHEAIDCALTDTAIFNQFGMRSGLVVANKDLEERVKELTERNNALRKANTLL